MLPTPASPQFTDMIEALSMLACLVIAFGAYQAQRRWSRKSAILSGPDFRAAVDRIEAGEVDAAGFGVLKRAYHQRQPTLPAHLRALRHRIEEGQRLSLFDPKDHGQIDYPTLRQFDVWVDEHFPDALG